jgi:hypothetical protein
MFNSQLRIMATIQKFVTNRGNPGLVIVKRIRPSRILNFGHICLFVYLFLAARADFSAIWRLSPLPVTGQQI